jgi:hypothetical protein
MVKCGILDEQLRSDRTALTASRTIWPACRRGCPQTVHLLALSWFGSTLKGELVACGGLCAARCTECRIGNGRDAVMVDDGIGVTCAEPKLR